MRTTITLEPDVADRVRTAMREHGLTFKETVNLGLRRGLGDQRPSKRFRQRTARLGEFRFGFGEANHVAGELEDEHSLEVTHGQR